MSRFTYIASSSQTDVFFNENSTYIASNPTINAQVGTDFFANHGLLEQQKKLFAEELQAPEKHADIDIPLSIFSKGLSGLEALSVYLKDVAGKRFCEIAVLLNRDDRTIWDAYDAASKKEHESFDDLTCEHAVPVSTFTNRTFSILESLTVFLKEQLSLRYCKIAQFVGRDSRTIWTVYNRAQKKIKHEKQ